MEADATDPVATGNALAALATLNRTALAHDLKGPLASLAAGEPAFELRVHRRYNPEGATEYNIVPGLIGTILTMTMVMMTAIAVTRERERGTMENLLSMPVRPFEVMLGKILPFVVVGYIQVAVILLVGKLLFGVPVLGSLWLLSLALVLFIAANLAVGFTFSTMADNQLQAMQMTFFFFLPSLLLSGFLFPFRGMPEWAQALGSLFPLTHFLRIVRGILLKGSGWSEIAPEIWPIVAFMLVAGASRSTATAKRWTDAHARPCAGWPRAWSEFLQRDHARRRAVGVQDLERQAAEERGARSAPPCSRGTRSGSRRCGAGRHG